MGLLNNISKDICCPVTLKKLNAYITGKSLKYVNQIYFLTIVTF